MGDVEISATESVFVHATALRGEEPQFARELQRLLDAVDALRSSGDVSTGDDTLRELYEAEDAFRTSVTDETPTVPFMVEQEDRDDRYHELWLDRRSWTELGRPETLTVKVAAGDTLNAGSVTHDHGGEVAEHTHDADGKTWGGVPEHSHDDEA